MARKGSAEEDEHPSTVRHFDQRIASVLNGKEHAYELPIRKHRLWVSCYRIIQVRTARPKAEWQIAYGLALPLADSLSGLGESSGK